MCLIYRDIGVGPDVYSYKIMMRGFAEKGDITGIQEMLEQAKKNNEENLMLRVRSLLSVLTDLVLGGYEDKLPEVIQNCSLVSLVNYFNKISKPGSIYTFTRNIDYFLLWHHLY